MFRKAEIYEFDKIYNMLEENFISDEYRVYEEQKLLFYNQYYKPYFIIIDNEIAGFIAMWDFEYILYLEHLVIDQKVRNKGIGTKILKYLKSNYSKNIVFEVELPVDELKQRRINFYKRNGFVLNNFDYIQPPMSKGKAFVPLLIMSKKEINNQCEFDKIKKIIYENVYKYKN